MQNNNKTQAIKHTRKKYTKTTQRQNQIKNKNNKYNIKSKIEIKHETEQRNQTTPIKSNNTRKQQNKFMLWATRLN